MGKQNGDAQVGMGNVGLNVPDEQQVALSQQVQKAAENDANAAAPSSLGTRLKDATIDGFEKIPQGFINSLDYHNILPNIATGFAIGGATRLILPEGGPVTTVAGLALGAYFLGKPLVEGYHKAWVAKTMGDMHEAGDILGNAVGGLPVAAIEGGIGAKLGSGLVGKLLATETAAPFTNWKEHQWNAAESSTRNVLYTRFGVGSPVEGTMNGIVPPHVLEELARRNPDNPDFLNTLAQTRQMAINGKMSPRTMTEGTAAREVYDAQGQEVQPGVKARFEGEKPTGNAEVDQAYDFTGDIRGYYKDVHGRNSIDGRGMKMVSTVNYGDNFENAFWDGKQMTYGNPGPSSPFKTFMKRNVAGHEVTHGVTEFESGLVYRNQPGALNEHLSDVFGSVIDQRALGQSSAQASWLIGDGMWKDNINGRALRDMRNPGTAYDDPAVGKDPQPAHMKDYFKTNRDNGGVHYNSGIPNKAFADFAVDVGGNSWEGPAQIWYKARALSGPTPSFAQFAFNTIEAAKQLGHDDMVPKLQKAWDGVGVKPSKTAAEVPIIVAPTNGDNTTNKPAA